MPVEYERFQLHKVYNGEYWINRAVIEIDKNRIITGIHSFDSVGQETSFTKIVNAIFVPVAEGFNPIEFMHKLNILFLQYPSEMGISKVVESFKYKKIHINSPFSGILISGINYKQMQLTGRLKLNVLQ